MSDILVSPAEPDVIGTFDLRYDPAVAYNARADEWLIVFTTRTEGGGSVVRGTRLDAGGRVLSSGELLADLGHRNDSPDLAYRPATGDYVLVWSAVDADGASDVYLRRLGMRGDPRGRARRLSLGRNRAAEPVGVAPAVAVRPASAQALAVWSNGSEIHACRVSGRAARRDRCLRVGSAGADPAVAYSPPGREYLVAWSGTPRQPGSPVVSRHIVGQHVTASGRELGMDDFPITTDTFLFPDGTPAPPIEAGGFFMPSVAADLRNPRYLVSYWGSFAPGPGELVQLGRLLQTLRAHSLD